MISLELGTRFVVLLSARAVDPRPCWSTCFFQSVLKVSKYYRENVGTLRGVKDLAQVVFSASVPIPRQTTFLLSASFPPFSFFF